MIPATNTAKFIKWSGGRKEFFDVTASATIKKGDLVTLSSNKVTQLISLPGSNNTASSASGGSLALLGIAEEDFTANGSSQDTYDTNRTKLLVAVADDTLRLEMRGYNATGSDAEQQDFDLATTYEIVRYRGASASEWWYMASTTTTGELTAYNRSKNSAPADDYGANIFKVTAANRQLG